ncbi:MULTISPECIES: conjugal transfer protein TrbA [Photorhabdus]|uniref:conjugal transfer protein TrbA n=1 Tax=Photorhabdus TaxID=29487 RepID=UPI00193DFABB|nr:MULTISPECIES: conjugal transfer protein TrbA [Photorhabdus]
MYSRTTQPPQQGQERGSMFLLVFFLLCFLIWIYQPSIMFGCCWLLYQLWALCDFPRVHNYVAERLHLLAWAANRVNDLSWSEFIDIMNKTADILMLPLSIIVSGSLFSIRNHPSNLTRRNIDAYSLPHIMSKFSPAIIPVLCYGDKKTQLLNCDPPEHRSAQTPDEFALQHQLIIGERLNRDKTREVFMKQLGTPLTEFSSFNAYERALFAVFGLQVFLNDRKSAEKLLDDLNRSCLIKSRRDNGKKGYPVLSLANSSFNRVAQHPEAKRWLRHYSTTRTALFALHDQDLRLPGARFRWLKGLDRILWYTLTSSGRPKVFVEGAGVIAAAKWERLISDISLRLQVNIPRPENWMDIAIIGLEKDLRSIGLVLDERKLQDNTDAIELGDENDDNSEIIILQSHEPAATDTSFNPVQSDSQQTKYQAPKQRTFSRPRAKRP